MKHAFNHSTLERLRQDDHELRQVWGTRKPCFQERKKADIKVNQNFQTQLLSGPPIYIKLEVTCSWKQGRPWSLTEESVPPPQVSHSLLQRLCPGKPPDVCPVLLFHPQKTGTCPDIPSSHSSILKATGLLNDILALKPFFEEPFWGPFSQLGSYSGEATSLSWKIPSIRKPITETGKVKSQRQFPLSASTSWGSKWKDRLNYF